MQTTEAIAKTKVCPFAHGFNLGQALCLGSRCMAWDWVDGEWEYYRGHAATPYRGAAYSMTAHWPDGSLPLGMDWEWEPAALKGLTQSAGWWRRLKPNREGQCGRTMILQIEQG